MVLALRLHTTFLPAFGVRVFLFGVLQGRGGPYCEFRLHIQNDLTVMLEGVKSPLQFISLLDSGKLGDPRGILDREPGKRFHVYCKVGEGRSRGGISVSIKRELMDLDFFISQH